MTQENEKMSVNEKANGVLERAKTKITEKRQLLNNDLAYFYISKRAGDNPPFCLMIKTDEGKKDLFSARRLTLEVATQAMELVSLFVKGLGYACRISLNKNMSQELYIKVNPNVAVS